MPRWLAAIVTVLVLAVQSIGAYARAGVKQDVACCCPDPSTCKCHDHDRDQPPQPGEQMKTCHGGVHGDAPIVVEIVMPEPPAMAVPVARAIAAVWRVVALPADRTRVPEKPPF